MANPVWIGHAHFSKADTTKSVRLHLGFDRVLHLLDLVELDIDDFAIHLLDTADVDGLDDVARLGVDRDRPARALPGHPLHGADQLLAIGIANGLLPRLV